jgi:hypothetical protein
MSKPTIDDLMKNRTYQNAEERRQNNPEESKSIDWYQKARPADSARQRENGRSEGWGGGWAAGNSWGGGRSR